MNKSTGFIALLFTCFMTWVLPPAYAATSTNPSAIGKIDSLQQPAWLERNNLTVAATPGTELFAGDKLRTGKGARLLMVMNEGSAVRLGENAVFQTDEPGIFGNKPESAVLVLQDVRGLPHLKFLVFVIGAKAVAIKDVQHLVIKEGKSAHPVRPLINPLG